jgi:hypothetical protein
VTLASTFLAGPAVRVDRALLHEAAAIAGRAFINRLAEITCDERLLYPARDTRSGLAAGVDILLEPLSPGDVARFPASIRAAIVDWRLAAAIAGPDDVGTSVLVRGTPLRAVAGLTEMGSRSGIAALVLAGPWRGTAVLVADGESWGWEAETAAGLIGSERQRLAVDLAAARGIMREFELAARQSIRAVELERLAAEAAAEAAALESIGTVGSVLLANQA